jgi:type VI protein secretion system component Hcp
VAPVYFLRLEGVDGESRDPDGHAAIALESFTWAESAGVPKQRESVTFTAPTSAASPALVVRCASGESIASAVLTMQDGTVRRQWWFSDVAITDYATGGGVAGPTDAISLSAARMEELRKPSLRFELIRPDDLLNLEVEAVNLRLDAGAPGDPALVVDDAAAPAALIVTLPPQTIAETAYFEAAVVEADPTPPVRPDPDAGKKASAHAPLDPPGVAGSRARTAELGQRSRLVFTVPADARLPYSTAGLIDWSQLALHVSPIAAIPPEPTPTQIAAAPAIQQPTPTETSLELPFRLVISPNANATWVHRMAPFTSHGRTELWHTRLALRAPDGPLELSRDRRAPLRAIWSPDYRPADPPQPMVDYPPLGRMAMEPRDRYQLVILTSAFHGWETNPELEDSPLELGLFPYVHAAGGHFGVLRPRLRLPEPYVPKPFEAEQLMLTPLGGWLRSRGHWSPPQRSPSTFMAGPDLDRIFAVTARIASPPADVALARPFARSLSSFVGGESEEKLDLSEWVHVATQGRDHYVRIVYEGRLLPFGHRAALVKVTERKFVDDGGIVVAYLMQRMFVVVREQLRVFDDRAMPFKRVQLTTLVTPDIAEPKKLHPTSRSFWVEVVASDPRFRFHAVGTDHGDAQVDFTLPMIFESIADNADARKAVLDAYNASPDKGVLARRDAHVPGQKVMFAKATDPAKRNTELVTESLNFVLEPGSRAPKLLKAEVRIPQVEELLGNGHPTTIRLAKDFVSDGVGGATGVFAEIATPDFSKFTAADPLAGMQASTLGVEFHSDQAGGFATPNLGVSALSRELGPLGGTLTDARAGSFDPTSFFSAAGATLFGSLRLADLLAPGSLDVSAPTMNTKRSEIAEGTLVVTTLHWQPKLKSFDFGPVKFNPDQDGPSTFDVHGLITRWPKPDDPGAPPLFDFTGTITNFRVDILDSVFVNFKEFGVVAVSKQKPDVTVALKPTEPVTFHGDLEFVEELRQIIPPGLFGDGPSLDISPAGIHAAFAIGLPPLAVGVFALKDVQLGAGLTLPLIDGKPVFDFSFSSREHPFLLAVAIFGGGGFFHLQLDTAGLKELEAALEFGATAALDIGVASGSVHMMAGVYFSLQRKDPGNELRVTLTGYLRVGGSLTVLALVTVSVEFNLSFTYAEVGKAYGRATLTVQIEIAFFSKSVELTVERTFAGQSGDPKFRDLFTTAATWSDYALAFARNEP